MFVCVCVCVYVTSSDCELVALLEDDTGMELLVNNKIISLDLPVADVYKKVWAVDHTEVRPQPRAGIAGCTARSDSHEALCTMVACMSAF